MNLPACADRYALAASWASLLRSPPTPRGPVTGRPPLPSTGWTTSSGSTAGWPSLARFGASREDQAVEHVVGGQRETIDQSYALGPAEREDGRDPQLEPQPHDQPIHRTRPKDGAAPHAHVRDDDDRATSIRRMQEWMGHSDLHSTMRYLHYAPRDDDARLVAEAFAECPALPAAIDC